MKNIVGQTPRGEDFFPRDQLINLIYRRLEGGSNVFLSASRRVGKTSLMRFLEDNPREHFHFIYVITESVQDKEEYFRRLLEEILRSDALSNLAELSDRSKNVVKDILGRIKSLSIAGFKVDLQEEATTSYQREFEYLLKKFDTEEQRVIVMVDEFPQTVENIHQLKGSEAAIDFLRINRSLRQQANANIQFVYTGSIGLPILVKRLGSLQLINDLNVVEVTPLTTTEARKMARELLGSYEVDFEEEALTYLLDKIHWLIPFHIQLAVQELIDVHEQSLVKIGLAQVDAAFDQITNKRNNIYFDSYFERLKRSFSTDQLRFVLALLNQLTQKDQLPLSGVNALADEIGVTDALGSIIDSLLYDGYIDKEGDEQFVRFNSSILRLWWRKYRLR